MADTPTSLGLLALAQAFRGDIVRQINRRTMLLKTLRIVAGEGKNVAWATEGDGQLAENYTEGADAVNFGGDAQAPAILNWGLYRSNIHVTQLAMDAAKTTMTPVGNRMLWGREVANASAKLGSMINQQMYTGPGTGTTIAGLDAAIGSVVNTYAGIDRTVAGNAYWRPSVVDPGVSTAITFPLIRDDLRKIFEASGENPDIALCSPSAFNAFGNLFDLNRRYVQVVNTARGRVTLDAGYDGLEMDGCVFVKDKDAGLTATPSIFYINTDALEIQYLPTANMSALPQMRINADDGFGDVPLGFNYEMLAKTGPSEKAEVTATIQLVCNRPNACGVRRNIAVP